MENQVSMGSNAETPQTAPETPPASGGGVSKTVFYVLRTVLAAFVIAGAIVSAGYAGLCAYAANGKSIWPGISVLGVDISGLTVEQAAKKLDDFLDKAQVDLYLYYIMDEGTHVENYRPDTPDYSFPLRDLGFYPDTREIAQKAYDMNVTDPDFLSLGWRYLTGDGETEYAPVFRLDDEQIAARAQEASETLSYAPTEIVYERDELTLTVTMPRNGRNVPAEPIVERLAGVLKTPTILSPCGIWDSIRIRGPSRRKPMT